MSAVAIDHDKERERVRLPGGIFTPSIAEASEKELRDCLERDLAALARIADQEASIGDNLHNASLTREGLLSPEWHEQARRDRSAHNNLSAVETIERRVRAIRAELPRREALHKLEVKDKAEETRRRLEGVVEHYPVYAGNVLLKAAEVEEAWARLRRFVSDVQLVAGGVPYIADQYAALRKGATLAAEALKMPAPEFEPLPSLPSKADVTGLLALFMGKGFDRVVPNIGDAGNVRELVRELNKK